MSLTAELLVLALCMILLSALPLLSRRVRKRSRALFLFGTGAMLGICFLDLVPETYALGGTASLATMAATWMAYSAVHSFGLFHHHHDPETVAREGAFRHARGFRFFLGPLIAHGIASGMLLAVSRGLTSRMNETVFLALLAHKAYESLLLASILVGFERPVSWKARVIASYALALPAGAAFATLFHDSIGREAAVLISGIAVGTLLGCLIFDFVLPSLRQLKKGGGLRSSLWLVAGFAITRLFMGHG